MYKGILINNVDILLSTNDYGALVVVVIHTSTKDEGMVIDIVQVTVIVLLVRLGLMV